MKQNLVILLLIIVCFAGCNSDKIICENRTNDNTTTKTIQTEYNISETNSTFQTKHIVDLDSDITHKKMAKVYEDYFNDKSKTIAVKANSFSVFKKDIIYRQKLYEIVGYDAKSARQMAIDVFIENEINYRQSLECGIKISEKELDSYIKEQMSIAKAKSTNKSYLNFLENISIEEVYRHERDNIRKELTVDKYYSYLNEKYGEESAKTEHRKIIERIKKSENIKILI